MKKIVLLFSPKGGSVDRTAQIVKSKFSAEEIDCFNVAEFKVEDLTNYETIILGGSTVGADIWQDGNSENFWDKFFGELESKHIDLSGKKVAIFGLGNQVLYPDHFVDGMIIMKEVVEKAGAAVVGSWPTTGYDFTNSKSVIDGKFVGLAIDEDNEDDMTEERVNKWFEGLK